MAKKTARKTASKKTASKATKRKAAKRELIDTGSDKRYVRRAAGGTFKDSDDVSRSRSSDPRKQAKTRAKRGQGDKGDR